MENDVLVLGGGVAGLEAARELVRHGFAVTVVEAKEHLGGRIHTIDEGRLPVELGAEFVHGRSRALLRAVRQAGLSMHTVSDEHQMFPPTSVNAGELWEQIDEVFQRINPRGPDEPFERFLQRQKLATPTCELARNFVEGFDAADAKRISAKSLLAAQQAASRMQGDCQYRVNEGYGSLVSFFEREIVSKGGRIETGSRVRKIQWRPGRVEFQTRRGREVQRLAGAAAVITLPLGVWQAGKVAFEPGLPVKSAAARGLAFGNVAKLTMVFRERWWGERLTGFVHAAQEELPTWWTDPRGPVLTGWAGGPKADALLKLRGGRLEAAGLKTLAAIFSERISTLRQLLVATHAWDWSKDPDILGAYSYIPVNGMDLPGLLASPVDDTLYFAGEATVADAQTGTVFGALETGLRAAREIIDRCGRSGGAGRRRRRTDSDVARRRLRQAVT